MLQSIENLALNCLLSVRLRDKTLIVVPYVREFKGDVHFGAHVEIQLLLFLFLLALLLLLWMSVFPMVDEWVLVFADELDQFFFRELG